MLLELRKRIEFGPYADIAAFVPMAILDQNLRDIERALLKFDTVALLQADTRVSYSADLSKIQVEAGDIVEAGGYRYLVAASGATDQHVTTAGSVKLYVLPDENGYSLAAFGPLLDGATDDTSILQAAIDALKGAALYLPKGKTGLTKGLVLNGSTYDGTTINILGILKQFPVVNPGYTTGGAPLACILLVRDCDGVTVDLPGHLDGNIGAHDIILANIHSLVIAGATNFRCPRPTFRNVAADGVYITMKDYNTISKRTTDFAFGPAYGRNELDGSGLASARNIITIIDAKGGTFGPITSLNIGGLISGQRMPGGFCIESNVTGQMVEDIEVASGSYIRHQGTGGITCHSGGGRNIDLGKATVVNDGPPTANDGLGNLTQAPQSNCLVVTNTDDFSAEVSTVFENAFGVGAIISNCRRPNVKIKAKHVQVGARIGADATDNAVGSIGVVGGGITVEVSDCCRYGVQEGRMDGVDLTFKPHDVTTGFYSTTFGELFLAQDATHKNRRNRRRIFADYDANWTRLRRWDSTLGPDMTDNDNVLEGGSIPLDYNPIHTTGATANPIREKRLNVPAVTEAASIPTTGFFITGQVVENSATPSSLVALRWRRLTTSGTHVAGTDWRVEYQEGSVYRTNAGTPVGAVVPIYIGEELFDTGGANWYKATGLTNADWKLLT